MANLNTSRHEVTRWTTTILFVLTILVAFSLFTMYGKLDAIIVTFRVPASSAFNLELIPPAPMSFRFSTAFSGLTKMSEKQSGAHDVKNENTTMAVTSNPRSMSVKTTLISKSSHTRTKLTTKPTSTTKPTPSVRPDSCTHCFLHNYNYVIENDVVCKLHSKDQTIDVLLLIFTSHARRLERDTIRRTWLTYSKNNTGNIRYAFLLGESKNKAERSSVLEENKVYHDILKEDFVDAYVNLTLKTIMAFKYATNKCAHAKFIMKTDDDMYVNIPSLLEMFEREKQTLQATVGGACFLQAGPIRDKNSKWYASYQNYPHDSYPGFCSGTGYVTSIAVAKRVFEISKNVPFFYLEDVYVALCIRKLGLKLHPINGFHNYLAQPVTPCVYKSKDMITSHQVSPAQIKSIWNTNCA